MLNIFTAYFKQFEYIKFRIISLTQYLPVSVNYNQPT